MREEEEAARTKTNDISHSSTPITLYKKNILCLTEIHMHLLLEWFCYTFTITLNTAVGLYFSGFVLVRWGAYVASTLAGLSNKRLCLSMNRTGKCECVCASWTKGMKKAVFCFLPLETLRWNELMWRRLITLCTHFMRAFTGSACGKTFKMHSPIRRQNSSFSLKFHINSTI